MSQQALSEYRNVKEQQTDRYQARHIRTKVKEARETYDASLRWPFELLQNALDAGPRDGEELIRVSLHWQANRFEFSHNGAPFSAEELSALLSGGSSKDFESSTTTGRFGSGFLVTHVLANETCVQGLLNTRTGLERFSLTINRAGDEADIIRNINGCNDAIAAATSIDLVGVESSASFAYTLADTNPLTIGIQELTDCLPYLFATCPHLGTVRLEMNDQMEEWTPSERKILQDPSGARGIERSLCHRSGLASAPIEYRCLRLSATEHGDSAVVVVALREKDKWRIRIPGPQTPRVFIKFPLRASASLPFNFVLDGVFDPDQERKTLLLSEKNKKLVSEAMRAAPLAVARVGAEDFLDSHLLARIGLLEETEGSAEDLRWWRGQLKETAQQLAEMPLVETKYGRLAAAARPESSGQIAEFVVPRWLPSGEIDDTVAKTVWPLLDSVKGSSLPVEALAAEWSRTADGWHQLGVIVTRLTLESVAARVRGRASKLEELAVAGDPRMWLVSFFDAVGELWQRRGGRDLEILKGLLPDQQGMLRAPSEVVRDEGISDALKDIAKSMGLDLRVRLLDCRLLALANGGDFRHAGTVLLHAVPNALTEEQVLSDCVNRLDKALEEGMRISESESQLVRASIRLFDYLRKSPLASASVSAIARKMPVLASDNTIVRWSPSRPMMAPVEHWPETARPFYAAYPPARVLASAYCGTEQESLPGVIDALATWGIAIPDPLTTNVPAELKDHRLRMLADKDEQTEGAVVSGEVFSHIALLHPEIINRSQEGTEEARALLGLVLNYIVRKDPAWRTVRTVKARKAGSDIQLRLRGGLWLADLLYRAWVPAVGEEGKTNRVTATADSLKQLLDPSWLVGNQEAVALLTQFFGFDRLDLRLLGITDAGNLAAVRDNLAKLVDLVEADPRTLAELSEDLEERRRRRAEIQRCRAIGLAVQAAVGKALDDRELKVELIDKGFDFEVSLLEEAASRFTVGPYYVEVKATTSGEVRLTPTQAETAAANPDCYVLCVVDLRSTTAEQLDGPWTPVRVVPLARFSTRIGEQTKETWDLVEWARRNDVAIRNDKALRYGVPAAIWETGCSIDEWVARIKEGLTPSAS